MNNRICYTYLIGWSNLNVYYYGSKYGKNADPAKFWVNYFTSSKHVKEFRRNHGEPNIKQIRKTFGDNIYKCQMHEIKVLTRIKADIRQDFLNKHIPKGKWLNEFSGHSDKTKGKIRRNYIKKKLNILNLKSLNELEHKIMKMYSYGLTMIDVSTNLGVSFKIIRTLLKDRLPYIFKFRIKKEKQLKVKHRQTVAKDLLGNNLGHIRLDDKKWVTGEIVSILKGRKFSEKHKENIKLNHAPCSGVQNSFYGKTHSEESKRKIANREYKSRQILVNGVKYRSVGYAEKILNLPRGIIDRLVKSKIQKKHSKYDIIATYDLGDVA